MLADQQQIMTSVRPLLGATQVFVDTVGDAGKHADALTARFPGIKWRWPS